MPDPQLGQAVDPASTTTITATAPHAALSALVTATPYSTNAPHPPTHHSDVGCVAPPPTPNAAYSATRRKASELHSGTTASMVLRPSAARARISRPGDAVRFRRSRGRCRPAPAGHRRFG